MQGPSDKGYRIDFARVIKSLSLKQLSIVRPYYVFPNPSPRSTLLCAVPHKQLRFVLVVSLLYVVALCWVVLTAGPLTLQMQRAWPRC